MSSGTPTTLRRAGDHRREPANRCSSLELNVRELQRCYCRDGWHVDGKKCSELTRVILITPVLQDQGRHSYSVTAAGISVDCYAVVHHQHGLGQYRRACGMMDLASNGKEEEYRCFR